MVNTLYHDLRGDGIKIFWSFGRWRGGGGGEEGVGSLSTTPGAVGAVGPVARRILQGTALIETGEGSNLRQQFLRHFPLLVALSPAAPTPRPSLSAFFSTSLREPPPPPGFTKLCPALVHY